MSNLLIRCPKCNKENYAPMVATGQCAWCGYEKGSNTEGSFYNDSNSHPEEIDNGKR